MKIFLRDTLTTAVFAGMLVCVISMIPYNTVEANNYSYKSHYMDTHAGDIRVLLLGNSLFEYSFNPHVVGDSVFDLATSARYIHYDVELAKRYLPRMEHLECVIYPLGLPEGYKERFKGPCMRDHYRYMHLDPPNEWKHLAASVEWDQRFHYKNFQRGRLCDSLGYQSMGTGVTGGGRRHSHRQSVGQPERGLPCGDGKVLRQPGSALCGRHPSLQHITDGLGRE